MDSDTFLYFAYGSNLLKKRIHINNPTAKFVCIAKLDEHRLDFIKFGPRWGGASGTIVPTPNTHVWGSVWRVDMCDMPSLDEQEGVSTNWYFPKDVQVETEDGSYLTCRTYQQSVNPPPRGDEDLVPDERRPSKTYLETIIRGAIECKVPQYYINMLRKIPHNGREACESMLRLLSEET